MSRIAPLVPQSLLVGWILLSCIGSIGISAAQECLEPPPDMTGWWPGDGNTEDIIGDPPQNAVLRGNATTGPSLVDDGFILDGDGDFVEIPHDPALNIGADDFTIDLWANFNSTAGEQILVEKYVEDFSGNAPGWSFAKLSNNALVVAPNSPQTPPLSLVPGQWYHFAVRRSSGVVTIFMNGVPMTSGPLGSGGNVNTTSSLKFGHRGNPTDTPGSFDNRGFFLNGHIDEIELFVGRALSDEEILDIYNADNSGKCKCPCASCNISQVNQSSMSKCITVKYVGQSECKIADSGFDTTNATPWLSVAVGQTTQVTKVMITPEEKAGDVDFQSDNPSIATVSPPTAGSSSQTLQVMGITAGTTTIDALADGNLLGSFNVAVYEKKILTVAVFVITPKKRPGQPKGGPEGEACKKPDPATTQASLQTGLNNIWDQAAVQFTVKKFVKKTVDFDVDKTDCKLTFSSSPMEVGLEPQAIIDDERDPTADINVYYVKDMLGTVGQAIEISGSETDGIFIFVREEHKGMSTEKATAHEIGHGLLGPKHASDITRLMYPPFVPAEFNDNCLLTKPEWDTSNEKAGR